MLYIHAGFHKTGSSTIQSFLAANIEALNKYKLSYPSAGRKEAAHFGLSDEILGKLGKGRHSNWHELLAGVARLPDHNHLISSESFEEFRSEHVDELFSLTDGLSVKIIMYIRDYVELVVSKYSQRVKKGLFLGDFDEFFDLFKLNIENRGISFFDRVSLWAARFGWDALRVRSLDRRGLQGGDLLYDFLSAVGLEPEAVIAEAAADSLAPRNVAPGWKLLEMLRQHHRMAGGAPRRSESRERERSAMLQAQLIGRRGERVARAICLDDEKGTYLSSDQWRLARNLYVSDITKLNIKLDDPIPIPYEDPPPERLFKPAFHEVPERERVRFARRLHASLERQSRRAASQA